MKFVMIILNTILKKEEFISRLNGAIVGIRDGKQISYADFGEMFYIDPITLVETKLK